MMDEVVTVVSTPDAMQDYALSIAGMNKDRIEKFGQVFLSLNEKRRASSYYIDTSFGKLQTRANVLHLINKRLERCF